VLGGTPFANRLPHTSHSLILMLRSWSYLLTHRCIPTQQRNGLAMSQRCRMGVRGSKHSGVMVRCRGVPGGFRTRCAPRGADRDG
jgi:hypothetical protein